MKKIIFTILVAATFNAAAQTIPSYVPTNGLVAWYPFNGNANDESGNGNNGTNINNVVFVNDRFGFLNSALEFPNFNSKVWIAHDLLGPNPTSIDHSVSYWVKRYNQNVTGDRIAFCNGRIPGQQGLNGLGIWNVNNNNKFYAGWYNKSQALSIDSITTFSWHMITLVFHSNINKFNLYVDGLDQTDNSFPNIDSGWTGFCPSLGNYYVGNTAYDNSRFDGNVDDIGIWNRALTQQEITDLYGASNCANNTTITPQINSITTGNNASFTATTSDANPSYVWQTNFGQGFQSLNNFGSYAGVNTSSLNIANVQLANHNQPIRVITTSGTCIDTSNIASIHIADTCISTQLVTVTDTLIIHANLTGISPPNNSNTIKVYPNPAQNYLIINNGNFALMSGYTCEIVNALGQQIFSSLINQQTFTIDISTWTGNGLYFLKIKDASNTVIENRKIVLN